MKQPVKVHAKEPQETNAEPTVTLTVAELQAFVSAEVARAMAGSTIQKVQAAFAPKAPPG